MSKRNSVGTIPEWLNGSLLRNGPGNLKVGDMHFNHLFDSSALLHRFAIHDGKVTYQCRFLQTETLKKNTAANRIVVTEFGTSAVPDPCNTIFQRFVICVLLFQQFCFTIYKKKITFKSVVYVQAGSIKFR